jgi:hypothetical protein
VDDYDMRKYTPRNGYHNVDYDEDNWWQPEKEYEYEETISNRRGNNNNYDINNYDFPETRGQRHLRPLGIRRSIDNRGTGRRRNSDYYSNERRNNYRDNDRNSYRGQYNNDIKDKAAHSGMSEAAWKREYDYRNEGYGGRNAEDYADNYYDDYYYNPDNYNTGDVRNRNEYEYADYDDGRRRRKRWSEDVDYYQSVPSYKRSDDDYLEPQGNERSWEKTRKMERVDEEDEENGKFSDKSHPFGYYTDDRYDDYPRRRPNIRDSVY